MRYTNSELPHSWIHGHADAGEGSNFYFKGDKIYSYGDHFCIARKIDSDTVLFNKNTYGNTTSQHQSYTLRAIPNSYNILYCDDPSANSKEEHRANYKALIAETVELSKGLIKRRVTADTFTDDVDAINALLQDAFEYSTLLKLGYKRRAEFVPNVEAIKATQAANRKRKAKAKKAQVNRNAKAIKQWLASKDPSNTLVTNNGDMLIVDNRYIGWSHKSIGLWIDPETVLVKVNSQLQVPDAVKFVVPYVHADRHAQNHQYLTRQADNAARIIRGSIRHEKYEVYQDAVKTANNAIQTANDYATRFYAEGEQLAKEGDSRVEFELLLTEHKAEKEAKRLEKERKQQAWLAGEGGMNVYSLFDEVTLRIKDDRVETSKSAHFPVSDCPEIYAAVKLCERRGSIWTRNGQTIKAGMYSVDKIDGKTRTLRAGCHLVSFKEIERVAIQLGLCED